MSNQQAPSSATAERRTAKLQWSLQGIFYTTLIVSVVLAIVAPFFRAWNAQQRATLIVIVCVELVVVVIAGGWCWQTRNRVLREAGGCYFRTSFRTRQIVAWKKEIPIFINLLALVAMQVFSINMLSQQRQNAFAFFPVLAGQISPLVIAAARFWSLIWGIDELDVELCRDGMIVGAYGLLRWENLVEVRPSELHDNAIVQVIRTGTLKSTGMLHVAREMRDEVIERINERIRVENASDS